MSCHSKEQAENRVKDAQADTLVGIASLVQQADRLDEALLWLHGDDVNTVRTAVAGIRELIRKARDVEAHLDIANHQRRVREARHGELEASRQGAPDSPAAGSVVH